MRYLLSQGMSDHASTSQVVLTDRNIEKFYNTVVKVFFCTWSQSEQWRIRLDLGNNWDWRCDRQNKEILIARRRYKNRDLFRSVLIQQIALAKTNGLPQDAWFIELDRARYIAVNLGRDDIADYLSQSLVRAQMGLLDISYDKEADVVTTRVPNQQTRHVDSLDEIHHDFEDSLHISFVNRHIDQAVSTLNRIKSPKAVLRSALNNRTGRGDG